MYKYRNRTDLPAGVNGRKGNDMASNYIKPEIGQTYTLRSGGEYRCLWVWGTDKVQMGECSAVLIRDKDGWKLTAHGIQQNGDGTIEWNYSTGGHWTKGIVKGDGKKFEVWKDCELGRTYKEKTFDTLLEASEWVQESEKCYPGWYLRIVEA